MLQAPFDAVIFSLEGVIADSWTAHQLAARKEDLFGHLLSAGELLPAARSLLERLAQGGTPAGLIASGPDTAMLLHTAGLESAFAVVVDRSAPATDDATDESDHAAFLEAVAGLGVTPGRVAVVALDRPGKVRGTRYEQ